MIAVRVPLLPTKHYFYHSTSTFLLPKSPKKIILSYLMVHEDYDGNETEKVLHLQ